jgi:Uma2 family endonuclease
MSTTTETGATPQTPTVQVEKEDPWRYGYRHIRHEGADGSVSYEEVPLRKEDLLYPEEGDRVLNTDGHTSDCMYLWGALKAWAAAFPDAKAFYDHRIDWGVAGLRPLGPDVALFRDVRDPWDRGRGTFPVARFGARTLLVIEVTSFDTRDNDVGVKVELYHRAGVPLYVIVDRPEASGAPDLRLLGYRADPAHPDRYAQASPDDRGRLWLEPVRLWLAAENGRAVLYDEHGRRILDHQEAVHAAAGAEARIRELEAQLQRLRGQSQTGPPNPAAP